jgi:hypothetical protein
MQQWYYLAQTSTKYISMPLVGFFLYASFLFVYCASLFLDCKGRLVGVIINRY